jgi:hypothetical protein
MAFHCKFGSFQYNFVSFGLSNALAAFQSFMDNIFKDMHNEFLVIYLDNLLIYSKDLCKHNQHVKMVLARLRQHGLVVNPDKCSFDVTEMDFLGHIVSPDAVSMDPIKSNAVTSWQVPESTKDVQVFLGFANYY